MFPSTDFVICSLIQCGALHSNLPCERGRCRRVAAIRPRFSPCRIYLREPAYGTGAAFVLSVAVLLAARYARQARPLGGVQLACWRVIRERTTFYSPYAFDSIPPHGGRIESFILSVTGPFAMCISFTASATANALSSASSLRKSQGVRLAICFTRHKTSLRQRKFTAVSSGSLSFFVIVSVVHKNGESFGVPDKQNRNPYICRAMPFGRFHPVMKN